MLGRRHAPFALLTLLVPFRALAADCGCDHSIPTSQTSVSGTALGVKPGDVVCIEAGKRPFLILEDLVGTEAAPVTIKNCGGRVEIANADKGYGLLVNRCKYFRLTGTGDAGHEYGFDVSATRTGPDYSASGVPVGDLSSDYEIDHLEVHHTGFAGFILKTESRCDGSANLGKFVQKNTRVHHTWVHDTGGEGFYVGSTGYGGRKFDCSGVETVLYPHEHDGVYLHDNRIEDTGWDGLQVGVTPKNCEVYANLIRRVGKTATDSVQTRGIQIGGASACKIYDNTLIGGPTIGIFVLGAAATWVANNLVVDFAEDGIYGNDQKLAAIGGSSYAFVHNTIVRSGGAGLRLFGNLTQGNAVVNNLFVESGAKYGIGGDVDATDAGNLELGSVAEALFEDPASDLYRLQASSPARDVGVVLPSFGVSDDHDGVARDGKPDVGSFEYTDAPPPSGGAPGGGGGGGAGGAGAFGGAAGSSAAPGKAGGSDDDGGCGCRVPGPGAPGGPTSALLLALLALVVRSRPGRSRSR
ncbi:MAG: right-handed parallel beta-helix repeat-containing protein [Sorangiineae bacterium PRO1]|nr:right-handed parallel beta-helix repeat-containing protein [Sorangiineae bacterium PRO1]